jgi:hypothetical protein
MNSLLLTILILIALWLVFAIFIPFILFPNYLIKPKIKETYKIRQIANKLKNKNPEKTLENAYSFVVKNHYGIGNSFRNKLHYFWALFNNNVENNIGKKTYIWCHTQNLILKTILFNTGQFNKENVKIKWTVGQYIHQYLMVKVGNKIIKIDPFYKVYKNLN